MTEPRPFSILLTAIFSGVINALINGAFGWFMLGPDKVWPLWGVPGIGVDTVAMAFGITFGTVLTVTPQTRAQLRAGKLLAAPISPHWRAAFGRWPRSTWRRSIVLGVLSALLFAPLPLVAFWAFGVDDAGRAALTSFKAAFGFVQGALVTPVIALAAMVTQPDAPTTS